MPYQPLPATFHAANRKRLAASIGDDAVAIIDTTEHFSLPGGYQYPYRPDPNFYYLTGIDQPEAVLVLIPGHADPSRRELLFIRRTGDQQALWEGKGLTLEEATKLSGIQRVHWLDDSERIFGQLLRKYQIVYLNTPPSSEQTAGSASLRRATNLRKSLPTQQLRSALPFLDQQRIIKDAVETEQIKRAIDVTARGLKRAWSKLKPGLHEYELQAELAAEFTSSDASRHAFPPIVASGANATTIHYEQNDAKIGHGDLVLFDIGAEVGWYASDISRTVPANGHFTDRQHAVYEAVWRAQQAGIKLHKPGASISAADEHVQTVLREAIAKLGLKGTLRDYYPHVSHHLGLDVHDTGNLNATFEPGMVVTCEPGLYLHEEGIGVRLEDDILITQDGCEVLSAGIPSDPNEIEKVLNERR